MHSSAASPGVFIERYKNAHEEDAAELELRNTSTASSRPNDSCILLCAACQLHNVVHSVRNTLAASAAVSNLSTEAADAFVPDILFNFVGAIVDADPYNPVFQFEDPKVRDSGVASQRVQEICQDIIFAASKERVHPPKHVALTMAVKILTESKQLASMLNGFGHCIGDCQAGEVDTAIAERILKDQESGIFIPSTVRYPSAARMSVAFDNMDINEETLTGSDTTRHKWRCCPEACAMVCTTSETWVWLSAVYDQPSKTPSLSCCS